MALSSFSNTAEGNPDKLPTGLGMIAGALAGTTQVIATNPMEAVKIRMQMAAVSGGNSSVISLHPVPSTLSVIKDLGIRGLYRGSAATLSRDVPFSMIFFQLFASFKNHFKEVNNSENVEFPYIFASGITAGAIGAFIVTPMDGKTEIEHNISLVINSNIPFL